MIESRFSHLKWTTEVAVLAITIIAGALLVYGHTNPPQSKFSVQDATTRDGNSKRIRAKPGFELVQDGNSISARRLSKPTEHSSDSWACMCSAAPASGNTGACGSAADPNSGGFSCDGNCGCIFKKIPK
jgi:hypothetical protein